MSEAAVCSLWGTGDRGMTFRDEALESMRRTIQPPRPRCGKRMTLTRVDPHTPGYETRTFDCSHCGYSVGEVVEIPSPEPWTLQTRPIQAECLTIAAAKKLEGGFVSRPAPIPTCGLLQ